jgi:TonB family protein
MADVSRAQSPSPAPKPPVAIYAPRPHPTAEMRGKHLKGDGMFLLHVRPDGTVSLVEIEQSTGQPILDKLSLDTFSAWRFKPTSFKRIKIPVTYNGVYPKE